MGADAQTSGPVSPFGGAITSNFEIYGARSEADLKCLKEMGFTQVILDFPQLARPADTLRFGVVLANWWDRTTPWSQVEAVLHNAQSLSRLVSINMMDEPNDHGLEAHAPGVHLELRRRIHESEFQDLPLSLTIYGPPPDWPASWSWMFLDYMESIDILRIDPYPFVAGKPLGLVARWIEQARFLMGLAQRTLPLTVVLQAWADGKGLPPVAILRVMAYMAVLSGVQTLSFFEYNPAVWYQAPGFTEDFRGLMNELSELTREFTGAAVVGVLDGDGLFQAEVLHQGHWTCFTINTLDQPNGRFSPLQVVRVEGRCPRPFQDPGPAWSPLARSRRSDRST